MSRSLELRPIGWLNVSKSASCAEVAKLVENSADFCSPNGTAANYPLKEPNCCLSPITYSARRSYRSVAYKTWAISTERQLNAGSHSDFAMLQNHSDTAMEPEKAAMPRSPNGHNRLGMDRASSEVPVSRYSEESKTTESSTKTDKISPMELNSAMTKSWPKGNASKPPMPPGRNGLRNGAKKANPIGKTNVKQSEANGLLSGIVSTNKPITNGYHKTVVEPLPKPPESKSSDSLNNNNINNNSFELKNSNKFGLSDWNLNKVINIFTEIQNTVRLETQTVRNGFYSLRKSLSRELITKPAEPQPIYPTPVVVVPLTQMSKPSDPQKTTTNLALPDLRFSNYNEAISHLKQELQIIRDHDMRMIGQLMKLHEEISEIKENTTDSWIDDIDDFDVLNLPKVPTFLTPIQC